MLIDAIDSPWLLRIGAATAVSPISSSSIAMAKPAGVPRRARHQVVEAGDRVGGVGAQLPAPGGDLAGVQRAEQDLAVGGRVQRDALADPVVRLEGGGAGDLVHVERGAVGEHGEVDGLPGVLGELAGDAAALLHQVEPRRWWRRRAGGCRCRGGTCRGRRPARPGRAARGRRPAGMLWTCGRRARGRSRSPRPRRCGPGSPGWTSARSTDWTVATPSPLLPALSSPDQAPRIPSPTGRRGGPSPLVSTPVGRVPELCPPWCPRPRLLPACGALA